MNNNKGDALYKVEFTYYPAEFSEVTGEELSSASSSIRVYKWTSKRTLFGKKKKWRMIGWFTHEGLYNYETTFFWDKEALQKFITQELFLTEDDRLGFTT